MGGWVSHTVIAWRRGRFCGLATSPTSPTPTDAAVTVATAVTTTTITAADTTVTIIAKAGEGCLSGWRVCTGERRGGTSLHGNVIAA